MAAGPSHIPFVPCALSRSERATCEISRRGSTTTAITIVTSAIAKSRSRHSSIKRGRDDVVEPWLIGPRRRTALTQSGNGLGGFVKNLSLSATAVGHLHLNRLQTWLAGASQYHESPDDEDSSRRRAIVRSTSPPLR